MTTSCSKHRREDAAPIVTPDEARHGLEIATAYGTRPTLAIACIDGDQRPLCMVVIDDCPGAAADVLTAMQMIARIEQRGRTYLETVAIGLGRPGAPAVVTDADIDMWPQLAGMCARLGITLMDWWVLGDGEPMSVRDQFNLNESLY
jgi:hypothetical protein